jgi:hypothetical protein
MICTTKKRDQKGNGEGLISNNQPFSSVDAMAVTSWGLIWWYGTVVAIQCDVALCLWLVPLGPRSFHYSGCLGGIWRSALIPSERASSCASFGTPIVSIARVCEEIQLFLSLKGTKIGWGPMVTGTGKKKRGKRWSRETIGSVVGNYWWLGGAIRLGLALKLLYRSKYYITYYSVILFWFWCYGRRCKVFTIVKSCQYLFSSRKISNSLLPKSHFN